MFLQALATAVPPTQFSQSQCWDIVEKSPVRARLQKRSRLILHSILRGDHGIATRHFAAPDIEKIFDRSSDELNAIFRAEGPALAARALTAALAQANLKASDLDALLICTCTGYLCPGLTSYVSEQLGLRTDAILQDLVGLGCGAAIPTLRAASHVLAAQPGATVACIAVEICSAVFFLDDDPGVIISACLFPTVPPPPSGVPRPGPPVSARLIFKRSIGPPIATNSASNTATANCATSWTAPCPNSRRPPLRNFGRPAVRAPSPASSPIPAAATYSMPSHPSSPRTPSTPVPASSAILAT